MANVARLDMSNGRKIRALEAVSKGHCFFCVNKGCDAKMYLCKEGTNSPYFSSYKKSDHAYDFCIDQKLSFHPDKIDESCFDLDRTIRRICHKADNDIHNRNKGTAGGTVGTGTKIGINSAKGIYAMCEYIGCGNSYNGISIDSIYLCSDNRHLYTTALNGFCVVKAEYYRKVKGEPIIEFIFKVSTVNELHLAAEFDEEYNAWDFYNRIKKRKNFKDLTYVIVSEWGQDNGMYDYTCHINKQSQIFFIND